MSSSNTWEVQGNRARDRDISCGPSGRKINAFADGGRRRARISQKPGSTGEVRGRNRGREKNPELRVRMGIHSGPVKGVTDLSEQGNIAGAGINIAQRVMDCGDAGHILLSKRVADDLEQYAKWRPLLHDLGSCEVKHGASLAHVNLYSDEFGNPECPKRLEVEKADARKNRRSDGSEEIDCGVTVRKFKRR